MKSKNEIIFFKSENEMVEYALSQYSINQDNPFYFVDLSFIEIQYNRFKSLLPNVIPYYSVKANNDPEIIKEMAHLGAGFDCASEGEIKQVLSLVNVEPQKIIFANPSKIEEHILLAKKYGIKRMTFDSVEELEKIIEEVIAETGATSMKDMGKVMQAAKAKTAGRADNKVINEIVKEKLS